MTLKILIMEFFALHLYRLKAIPFPGLPRSHYPYRTILSVDCKNVSIHTRLHQLVWHVLVVLLMWLIC